MARLTAADVLSWGGLCARDPQDAASLDAVVAATEAYVNGLPVIRDAGLLPGDPWPDDVRVGALMLALRTWRRRSSPAGIESATDTGVAYVARYDPDVTRLLHLDMPGVG